MYKQVSHAAPDLAVGGAPLSVVERHSNIRIIKSMVSEIGIKTLWSVRNPNFDAPDKCKRCKKIKELAKDPDIVRKFQTIERLLKTLEESDKVKFSVGPVSSTWTKQDMLDLVGDINKLFNQVQEL